MSELEQWLTDLGLERYLSVFSDAEIELIDLPELSDTDLKELGLPLGSRRRPTGYRTPHRS